MERLLKLDSTKFNHSYYEDYYFTRTKGKHFEQTVREYRTLDLFAIKDDLTSPEILEMKQNLEFSVKNDDKSFFKKNYRVCMIRTSLCFVNVMNNFD